MMIEVSKMNDKLEDMAVSLRMSAALGAPTQITKEWTNIFKGFFFWYKGLGYL